MTKHSPITPPPELQQFWVQVAQHNNWHAPVQWMQYLSEKAAKWGADTELEACCELLQQKGIPAWSLLRLHRRPKSQSLKEQALKSAHIEVDPQGRNGSLIIRALEALPDD